MLVHLHARSWSWLIQRTRAVLYKAAKPTDTLTKLWPSSRRAMTAVLMSRPGTYKPQVQLWVCQLWRMLSSTWFASRVLTQDTWTQSCRECKIAAWHLSDMSWHCPLALALRMGQGLANSPGWLINSMPPCSCKCATFSAPCLPPISRVWECACWDGQECKRSLQI